MNFLCSLLLVFVASVPCALAGAYKWVDERGVTHYSQIPPSGKSASEMAIPKSPAPPAAQGPSPSTGGSKPAEGQDKPEPAAEAEEAARVRQENCKRARENLGVLESSRRIRVKEGDDYRMLGETERLQKAERLRQQIQEFCE